MKLFRRSIELVVIRDIFNPQSNIETYHGNDVEQLLKQAFGGQGLSESVRLYHGNLLDEVTPKTPQDVDKVMRLNGRIYAVVKPLGILNKAVNIFMQVTGLGWLMRQLTPEMPNMGSQTSPPSPNNALAARTNKQRLGGRIPDIFGQVWSVPDLIAPTYSVYIDHDEVEYSYMCIGRGRYDVTRAFDDTSDIEYMRGTTVQIYGPNQDITLEDPVKQFGQSMTSRERELSKLAVKRYTAVNGQVLQSPEKKGASSTFVFSTPNIVAVQDTSVDLRAIFKVGDKIVIDMQYRSVVSHKIRDGQESPMKFGLGGSYTIAAITATTIKLYNPSSNNGNWADFASTDDYTLPAYGTIKYDLDGGAVEPTWAGPFYTDDDNADGIMVNFVAPAGIYTVHPDGDKFAPFEVVIEVKTEKLDAENNPIAGTEQTEFRKIKGRGAILNSKGEYALTTEDSARRSAAQTSFFYRSGRHRVWVRRYSKEAVPNPPQQYFEEVRVKDLYSYRLLVGDDAVSANTTRVYSKTVATEGALSLKERKLRLLVQRYVTDATSGLPKLSNRADDIIRHIATDPKIGNLQLSQIDIAQIKAEIDAQIDYFGTEKCAEFCGTFDDNNLSAEETLQTVGKAVFSQAKRQGNKIMLDFERIVPASVAVFNSHNILPDTFTASESLGIANDYDGVTVEYTDPTDDATVTLSYPSDSLINPHEDKLIGVRNKVQAHIYMMRLYNKDRHAYKTCEFTAGDESNIVVRTNRITVADQLRANIQQGSVDSIETVGSDIVLYTTDPVTIEPSVPHTLFIQTINNGVEAIEVTARDDYSVKLARLPSGEISTGYDKVVQATYQIVTEEDKDRDAYLVSQKDPSEAMTNKLICTNYDDRYYQNDSDYINGLIT